jgi:hypothetical protein
MAKRLGLALILGAVLASGAWARVSSQFDGQYVGKLTLTRTVSGDCTEPPPGALYPLTISAGRVQFKYVPRFDTILIGTIDENGMFKASRHVRAGLITMTGRVDRMSVAATIASPSCNYTFRTGE